jgi:hypothetical protein
VLVTPPVLILGIRGYSKDHDGKHAEFDVYAEDIPKNIAKEISIKNIAGSMENAESRLKRLKKFLQLLQFLQEQQD